MTPQNDSSYTSLLFTPRTGDGSKALPDYRTPRNGDRATATRSPSPTPEYGRPSREGSVSFAAAAGGPFGGGSRSFRHASLFHHSQTAPMHTLLLNGSFLLACAQASDVQPHIHAMHL